MKSLLPIKVHYYIYVFALCLLVIGMPVSKFLMSLSQFILFGNWLLEGDFKQKGHSFFRNKPALALCSIMLLHFVGLLYSSDLKYAFKDIITKAPLLVLPVLISTSRPLPEKAFDFVLKIFIASVLFSTLVSTSILLGIYKKELDDIRGVSIFISHIRFALLICVSFYFSIYFLNKSKTILHKFLWFVLILWWPFFMLSIQSLTGLITLLLSSVAIGFYYLVKYKSGKYKLTISTLFISVFVFLGYEIVSMKNEIAPSTKAAVLDNLPIKTIRGNFYTYDEKSTLTENGNLIWMYVCYDELEPLWNKRSKINFNSIDRKGNELKFILLRFLASKNLKKDADGLNALTAEEINAIENGITNVKYMNISSFKRRVYETLWEIDLYNKTHDANGHSLTQRFEYWKTACAIIKDNLIFGVGTGDIAKAFEIQYEKSNTLLKKEWRLRSHNQYLSFTVAFGLIGLLLFLFSLFYPPIKMGRISDFLFFSFFCVAMLSFFTEDTLETQAGVTFYAFINCFLLFTRENKYSITPLPDYKQQPLLWRNSPK